MNEWLTIVLSNSMVAAVMLLVVALAKRLNARPQVLHVLCVLVLIKLITPPLWRPEWNVLPPPARAAGEVEPVRRSVVEGDTSVDLKMAARSVNPESDVDGLVTDSRAVPTDSDTSSTPVLGAVASRSEGAPGNAEGSAPGRSDPAPNSETTVVTEPATWSVSSVAPWLFLVWLGGSGAWFLVSVSRMVRFARCLSRSEAVGPTDRETAVRMARRLRLQRIPRVRFVAGDTSPMLWAAWGRASIVLPIDLWNRLQTRERESLMLHELAHYRRGDHWIRFLEFAVTGIYWWNPLVWIARRQLRCSEEECCDQLVVSTLPEAKRDYAEAIVKTLGTRDDDLGTRGEVGKRAVVPGGTAMGWLRDLEERLTRIMLEEYDPPMSPVSKWGIGMIGCLVLTMSPMLVREPVNATAAEAKALLQDASHDVVTVRVHDQRGQPVANVKVWVFLQGERVKSARVTDRAGHVQLPRDWMPSDAHDSIRTVLWVNDPNRGLGWKDLGQHVAAQQVGAQRGQPPQPPTITLLEEFREIEGSYVDQTGRPIPEVRAVVTTLHCEANGHIRADLLADDNQLGLAVSDAQGQFRLRLPAKLRYAVRAEHRDWIRKELYQRDPAKPLGRLELSPAGRIEGRVLDTSGMPLSGQRVAAQTWQSEQLIESAASWASAITDDEGWYVIGGLPAGRFNVLYLGSDQREADEEARQVAVAREGVRVKVDAAVQADLTVLRGTRVFGHVVDVTTGAKLPHIHVGYVGPARPGSGAAVLMKRSDADGAFDFIVPEGLSHFYVAEGDRQSVPDSTRLLNVDDRDFGPFTLKAGPRATDVGSESAMASDSSAPTSAASPSDNEKKSPDDFNVRLRIQPPIGRNVASVIVRTVSVRSQRSIMWSSHTGELVEIPFSRREGPVKFVVEASGYQLTETKEVMIERKNPILTVPLVDRVVVPIQGQLVDVDGHPVSGARVRLRRDLYRDVQFPYGPEQVTDDDGNFVIRFAAVGDRVQVRIDQEGSGGAESKWIVIQDAQAVQFNPLVLQPADKKLGGYVKNFQGTAVSGATVSLLESPSVRAVSDPDGKFLLEGVSVGEQSLLVKYKDRPPVHRKGLASSLDNVIRIQTIRPEDRQQYTVKIQLHPTDGKPIRQASFYGCLHKGDHLIGMHDRTVGFETWDFTELRRRYPDQKLVVCVLAKGYRFAMSKPFEMTKNPPPVNIDLEPADPVTLTGVVVGPDGQPVAGARVGLSVRLTEADNLEDWNYYNSEVEIPTTDAQGRFAIPDQCVGSHVAVYVKKQGLAGTWSQRVTLTAHENELPTITLPPATMQVAGQVTDHKGRNVSGAIVELLDLGVVRTRTDQDGRFQLEGLGDRKFLMQVISPSGHWNGTIRAGQTDRKIRLMRGL